MKFRPDEGRSTPSRTSSIIVSVFVALVAQWIEQLRPKEKVGGSTPSQGAIFLLALVWY